MLEQESSWMVQINLWHQTILVIIILITEFTFGVPVVLLQITVITIA